MSRITIQHQLERDGYFVGCSNVLRKVGQVFRFNCCSPDHEVHGALVKVIAITSQEEWDTKRGERGLSSLLWPNGCIWRGVAE